MGALYLVTCAGGIIVALGAYGFIQERIMAMPYVTADGTEEYFKITVFLVLINRLVACTVGLLGMLFKDPALKPGQEVPALWKYCMISCSNICATTCQYEALKYVSFPTQTLGKSMKMVPTMIMGFLLYGKRFPLRDWLISMGVTGGCVLFLLMGSIASKKSKAADDSMYGLGLLVAYLAFDAFTPTVQAQILQGQKASRYRTMFWTNLASAIMSTVYLTANGVLPEALAFVARHPSLLQNALVLSAAATTGQLFIYATLAEYSALVLAAIMNVRQLVQVCVSMVAYSHQPTPGQVGGLSVVFGALFLKAFLDSTKKTAAKDDKKKK
jgi:adenosine 3'-phospho 5'-phosphosulfate transporter B2